MTQTICWLGLLAGLLMAKPSPGQGARGTGADARVLRFPEQVSKRALREDAEGERLFREPRSLEVRPGAIVVTADKITLAVLVVNTSTRTFPLVVNPYGGAFPYGGDNPLVLRFVDQAAVTYSGKRYPPEPPLPMLIEIPGASSVRFQAEIDLRNYSYRGSPQVDVAWSFHFLKGTYPQGQMKVRLPAR